MNTTITATVRKISDHTDEILGARVELDGRKIGRVRRYSEGRNRGRWQAYKRNTASLRPGYGYRTREEAVAALVEHDSHDSHYCPSCGSPNAGSCPDCSF